MALQGTIDAFPLTDVLHLLSTSARSGRLVLDGDRGTATLWIEEGHVTGGGPRISGTAPAESLVFEMLRFEDGSFVFDAMPSGERPEHSVEPTPLAECIAGASALRQEWAQVEAVVPSMQHRAHLVADPPGLPVTLDAGEWLLVVAAGSRPTVAAVCAELGLDELSGARLVAGFVQRGLLAIDEPDPGADADVALDAPAPSEPADRPTHGIGTAGAGEAPTSRASRSADAGHDTPPPAVDRLVGQPRADAADTAEEFPDRFPIDDLVGAGESDPEAWISNGVDLTATTSNGGLVAGAAERGAEAPPTFERTSAPDTSWDELIDDALEAEHGSAASPAAPQGGDSADEVLRQMSRLSPQAAEAIAAALNTGADRDEDEQADGGSSFMGSF